MFRVWETGRPSAGPLPVHPNWRRAGIHPVPRLGGVARPDAATAHQCERFISGSPMSKLTALRCAAGVAVLNFIVQLPSVAQSPGRTEAELIAIQKGWADARVKPDIAYLERLYAKEFRVHT